MNYFKGLNLTDFEKELYDGKSYKKEKILKKDHRKYGFDVRTTWNLDTTLLLDIYARLNAYLEHSNVDLIFHKVVNYNKKQVTLDRIIDDILEDIKFIINSYSDTDLLLNHNNRIVGIRKRMFYNLSVALPYLWW